MERKNNLKIIEIINIKNLFILFMILQPIFDLKIFYNSISTLIRVICILLFFAYYFIKSTNKKKFLLLIYPIIVGFFCIFHHLNALKFYSLVPGNFNYSLFNESLYILKMICPFLLIYSLFKSDISKNDLLNIMKIIVLVIGIIIVASNLFLFSYGSYSDTLIKANFFEWFNRNSEYTYQDLASKGLFESANQISAVLLMCLPFILLSNFEEKNKVSFIVLLSNLFALILLSTKVAVLGVGLVFAYTFFSRLIFTKRIKFAISILILFIIYALFLPFNPTFSRITEAKKIFQAAASMNITEDDTEITQPSEQSSVTPSSNLAQVIDSSGYKIKFIEDNYKEQLINENFIINRYPYIYDYDFWYEILNNNMPKKSDYRFLERAMVKRVVEINNNPMDKLFGITYTRVQNIFNIEKDFIMQYYSVGILGLILLIGPYFVILGYWGLKYLNAKFKNMSIYSLLAVITICMLFGISYYSGNLLNSLSFTIYFTMLFGIMIKNYNEKGE